MRVKTEAELMMALQTLLKHHTFETQQDITQALKQQGFNVNQVKISRLLHKIGALKINENQRIVYRLPLETVTVKPNDSLQQLILSIEKNEFLIVIQTAPGCAQFIARFLDQRKTLGILGTVAGDDTIFITPINVKKITPVFQTVKTVLLGKADECFSRHG